MMRASLGFRPRREVFDTMIAAQLLGIEQIGLAALIERFFAITIGKEGQKSDWSRRPLSEKQLRYAVNDTRFLERLADRLGGELGERGRVDWHVESCRAMVESTRPDNARDPEVVWRIKGRAARPASTGYLGTLVLARPACPKREPALLQGLWQSADTGLAQWAVHPGLPLDQDPNCRITSPARG
jgi:ribonuclease D